MRDSAGDADRFCPLPGVPDGRPTAGLVRPRGTVPAPEAVRRHLQRAAATDVESKAPVARCLNCGLVQVRSKRRTITYAMDGGRPEIALSMNLLPSRRRCHEICIAPSVSLAHPLLIGLQG